MAGTRRVVTITFVLCLLTALSLGAKAADQSVAGPKVDQPPATSTAPPARPEGQPRGVGELYGVIVGVADYFYISDLYYPDDGAKQIHQQMEAMWGERAHLRLLIDRDATRDGIEGAMEWLALHEDADDTVLFYFTGHGDENHIMPSDSLARSYANDISAAQLDRWLDALDSKRIVVVIDSCRSGAYAQGLCSDGRWIVSSCAANEDAYCELSDYLVEAFSYPEKTDADTDCQISVEEVYAYVADQHIPGQHPLLFDNDPGALVLLSRQVQ